jgi:hypothetical protein
MSVAAAIRQLIAKGFSLDQALMAAEIFEASATPSPPAAQPPARSARQERNARYYQNRKDRLKGSGAEAPKTTKTPLDEERLNSDAPRARVEDNLLPQLLLEEDSGSPATPSNAKQPSVRDILLECLPGSTADAVIDHRKVIRMPLKPSTARHLVDAFKTTNDPVGAASMMVRRGWRGFEPAWYEREKSHASQPSRSVHDAVRRLQERAHAGELSFSAPPPSPLHLLHVGRR